MVDVNYNNTHIKLTVLASILSIGYLVCFSIFENNNFLAVLGMTMSAEDYEKSVFNSVSQLLMLFKSMLNNICYLVLFEPYRKLEMLCNNGKCAR